MHFMKWFAGPAAAEQAGPAAAEQAGPAAAGQADAGPSMPAVATVASAAALMKKAYEALERPAQMPGESEKPANNQWRLRLHRLHDKLQGQGKAMTKERCTVLLESWEVLPKDMAVYHIIPPAAGGVDHPHNFCILPSYVPTDYHLRGKAVLHQLLMVELLPKDYLTKAAAVCVGQAKAEASFSEMQSAVTNIKKGMMSCATGTSGGGGAAVAPAHPAPSAEKPAAKRKKVKHTPATPAEAAAPPTTGGSPPQ